MTELAKYKKYKNILTSTIRQAEKNYFSDKLRQVRDNMAKTWKILNSMTNRSKSNKTISCIEHNNVKLTSSSAIAEKFNDFFVNFGPDLARNVPSSPTKPSSFLKNDYCKSIFLAPTTAEEIADIVSNLKKFF